MILHSCSYPKEIISIQMDYPSYLNQKIRKSGRMDVFCNFPNCQDYCIIFYFYKKMDSIKYDVFKLKSEQVKFNAFFQYLKSFSEAGLDTLQKLENDFNKQMKKKTKQVQKLSLMKSILSSYEIFILEIKDSCDFVQIPQFGFCVGKAFVQLIKIIKWFLRAWLKNSRKYEKVALRLQTQEAKQNEEKQPHANICEFCEQLIKFNPYSRDGRNKRKGLAVNDLNYELRNAKKNHMNQMNQVMEFKEQVLQKYVNIKITQTLKDITSKRYISDPGDMDILNRKHMAMKLEISDNGSVLEEILNQFNLKTESIARFVANTQAMCVEDFKMSSQIDYSKFQQDMKIRIAGKFEEARQKLKSLVANRIMEFQRTRKSKLVDKEIQVQMKDFPQKDRLQQKIKMITASYHKLKNELESQRSLNENLRKLLESKSVEFQQEFLNYRKHAIVSGQKGKQNLKSLKSFKQILEDKDEDNQQQGQKKSKVSILPQQFESRQKFPKKFASNYGKQSNKKNSIKFTFENQSSDQQHSFGKLKYRSQKPIQLARIQAECQTQPFYNDSPSGVPLSSHTASKKFFIINRDASANNQKNKKLKTQQVQKKSEKKLNPIASLYSHIGSKINFKTQKIQKREKKIKTNIDQYMKSISMQNSRDQPLQEVKCFKVKEQPEFLKVCQLEFTKADVINLYLNYKNAHNYECLLYRSPGTQNDKNLNQKRAKHISINLQSTSLDQFKVENQEINPTQLKLVNIIYQQLANIKKNKKNLHNQIKLVLRSPTQIGQNLDVVYLQNYEQSVQKDIQLVELKKMVNLIFKFHSDCVGEQKEVVCTHLVNFFSKIGINIVEINNT